MVRRKRLLLYLEVFNDISFILVAAMEDLAIRNFTTY